MYELNNFNLQSFQQKVIEEYKEVKFIKDKDEAYFKDPYKKYADPMVKQSFFNTFVWSGFFKVIAVLEKKATQAYRKKPENVEAEKRSKEIIFQPKIRKILCPSLRQKLNPDLLAQEKTLQIIKIVTTLLTEARTAEEFSIKIEPKLFAYMVYEISQAGIEAYCQN